jgi:hypothetical protein
MIIDELERIRKEVVVADKLLGGTEENHKSHIQDSWVSRPRFEPSATGIRVYLHSNVLADSFWKS